jgi:poly-gamma-glutamate capsule biosynthesis protein CapA/YwtB (metallophosphatase superfamily)
MKKLFLMFLFLCLSLSYTEELISVNAVGDVMIGTLYPVKMLPPEEGASAFKFVKTYLTNENPDIVMGNLEGTITHHTYTHKNVASGRYWAFRMPPESIQYFKDVGFTVLTMANNHAYDFEEKGYNETRSLLDSVGIRYAGKPGEYIQLEIKGKKVAVIPFSYFDSSNNHLHIEESMAFIRKVAATNDIVIISFHGGAEGEKAMHIRNELEYHWGEKRGRLIEFCHKAVDNGANLIIGSGPHVPRAMEIYKGKLIAYSLGNFATYTMGSKGHVKYSLILNVKMDLNGDFNSGRIIPLMQFESGEYKALPYYDEQKRSVFLIRDLSSQDFKNNPIRISDDGIISQIQ